MTRAEYKTEPDKIAVKDHIRVFNEYSPATTAGNSSGQDIPNSKHRKTSDGD